jgi:hypothetical protein
VGSREYTAVDPRSLRTLDEFKFLVAVDERCECCEFRPELAKKLNFVEYEASLADGAIHLPVSEPSLMLAGDYYLYIVVVLDTKTGKMEKLVDAPGVADWDDDYCVYELEGVPGDDQVMTTTLVNLEGEGHSQSVSIASRIWDGDDMEEGTDEQMMRAIAGMFV